MIRTVAGLFRDPIEAQVAVHDLEQAGFARSDISVVTHARSATADEHASGTIKGAAIGGVAGALLGVAALAIPGIGPVLAIGPIAAALTGAGVGAATGGIFAVLSELGVPDHEAQYWEEGVRGGGTLLIVHATEDTWEDARSVLNRHGAAAPGQPTPSD